MIIYPPEFSSDLDNVPININNIDFLYEHEKSIIFYINKIEIKWKFETIDHRIKVAEELRRLLLANKEALSIEI